MLGLAPLLYEQSTQAQFLKPTVITLVYGLGFGMVLVLLVVPALIAIQADFIRPLASFRRALGPRSGAMRGVAGGMAVVLLAWLAATMGWVLATGALAPPLAVLMPGFAAAAPLQAALTFFVAGALAVLLAVYPVAAMFFRRSGRMRRA